MSLNTDINDFFQKYGDFFDLKTINYTKQVVYKIKTSDILEGFLMENDISSQVLLNEMTPYSQFKLKNYGDEKLNLDEIQAILNIILFSHELEKMILDDHIRFSSIGEIGEVYYIADEYAADYFNDKFGLGIEEDEEFDFTILDDNNRNDSDVDIDFSLN